MLLFAMQSRRLRSYVRSQESVRLTEEYFEVVVEGRRSNNIGTGGGNNNLEKRLEKGRKDFPMGNM